MLTVTVALEPVTVVSSSSAPSKKYAATVEAETVAVPGAIALKVIVRLYVEVKSFINVSTPPPPLQLPESEDP